MTRPLTIMMVIGLLAAAAPSSARAQCEEGRVSTPETLGRCCWPGQTFADAHGRCSGPPACPSPLVAEGDTCIARQRADEPVSEAAGLASSIEPAAEVSAVPPGYGVGYGDAPGAPSALGLLWPAAPDLAVSLLDPQIVRGTDQGLLITGITFFAAGYISAILIGITDQAVRNCSTFGPFGGGGSVGCDTWPLAFIPIVGGALAGTLEFNGNRNSSGLGIVLGPIVGIFQLFGLGVLAHAAVFQTEDVISGIDVGEAQLSFAPYATDSEGGLAVHVDF